MGQSTKPIPVHKSESLNTDPSQNSGAPPVGAPEGTMTVDQVNDTQRWDKGAIREDYNWLEALDQALAVEHRENTNATSGVNTVHPVATIVADGFMSAADKTTLDGLAAVGAPVTSVFARQGDVIANTGDYTAAQITNVPAGNIASTSVQTAINELDNEKADDAAVTAALAGKVDTTYNLQTGAGISGGGDFTQVRTLELAFQEFSEAALAPADLLAFVIDGQTTHRKVQAQAAIPLFRKFESAQQLITNGGQLTLGHNMGVMPGVVEVELVCQTDEAGYTAGQVVAMNDGIGGTTSSSSRGVSIIKDATNLTIRWGSAGVAILDAATGNAAIINNANWRAVFKAWG